MVKIRKRNFKMHYLSYQEQGIIEKFDKGPTVTEEIKTIMNRPHNDPKTERVVPPLREKKKITFE